jgi:hypothetical protein
VANLILLVAVNRAGVKSTPFRIYDRKELPLKGKFVLRLDDAPANDAGDPQVKIGNYELGLIGTNGAEYIESKLAGFRRKSGDDIFVVVERFNEGIASVKALEEAEEF